uniref:protein-tyrosine-phosphatase n=1 Tax=Phallusia mammillata TaxID=59560 RepID=A0A6F9DQ42_9ASCI|nr:receptor-type tyrosine-protein phosphatase kappa [Phallusia mammillata]
MEYGTFQILWIALSMLVLATKPTYVSSLALGSCEFEGQDPLCSYQQSTEDNFDWQLQDDGKGGGFMQVQTHLHRVGQTAKLTSPEINQQGTHCFSFNFTNKAIGVPSSNNGTSGSTGPPGKLNVYVLDETNSIEKHPVWSSPDKEYSSWQPVFLALNPQGYQVQFEALVMASRPGEIQLDDIMVKSSACESAPHFLRFGNKEVNAGQNQTLQCLLWGYPSPDTQVLLQKSTGEVYQSTSVQEYDDHLGVIFSFMNVALNDAGYYRCVSGNATSVGVSNFGSLSVKVPPIPRRGPKVEEPGATSFKITLNADKFIGDGPIAQKVLHYRPVNGDWSDVHHITEDVYELWHLQPDTSYQLSVTLVRAGPGGDGPAGPKTISKTKCGPPVRSVTGVKFERLGSDKIRVKWTVPDISVTQCRRFSYVVKYRKWPDNDTESTDQQAEYDTIPVENRNVAMLRGLDPYTMYGIKVELSNIIASQETGEWTVQTLEGVPGPVPQDSFHIVHFNETTVTLVWDEPLSPNGKLRNYNVLYKAVRSSDPQMSIENETGFREVEVSGRRVTLALAPGTDYIFQVRAKTSAGTGPSTEITGSTSIAPPTMPQYPPQTANSTVTTPTTIEILLIPAEGNGAPVSNYYIIVEDVTPGALVAGGKKTRSAAKRNTGKGKRRRKNRNRNRRDVVKAIVDVLVRRRRQAVVNVADDKPKACFADPVSFDDAKKNNASSYAGARFSPDQVTQEMKFVVGDNQVHNGFSNPPLDPNRDYNIYIRAESKVGNETKVSCVLAATKASQPPPTTPAPGTATPADGDSSMDPTDPNNNEVIVVSGGGEPGERNGEDQDVMLFAAIGGAAVGLLIISIAIVLVILKYKRQKKSSRKDEVVNPFEVRMMMSDISPAHTYLQSNNSQDAPVERQQLMPVPDVVGYEAHGFHQLYVMEKGSENGGTGYGGASSDERFAVRVDDFHVHVSQMKATGGYGFREEFAALPDGQTAPWTIAENPQNRTKNRYGNVMAYDHSRVVLDPVPGHEDEYTGDYINASFVNGYRSPATYIATQAPTDDTVNDFWWMIWQEGSSIIVMVTNLVELSKKKSVKYWPDECDTYGSVQVSLSSEERTADYVIRSFILQQSGGYDAREVKQYHFTSWPDHGVPSRPTNLLSYIRRVKSYEPPGQGPTVVHCSAGSGRTGCYITIDMMLDMAREEEIVDIHNTVRDLRTRRINMVQTEEQYVFIHEAVLEALLCGETSVSAEMLVQHYDDLITVDPQSHFAPIQEEFETLNVITPKLSEEECTVARLPRNRASNRFMDVLPADRHLAYLSTPDPMDRDNNYINAVFVDSYTTQNQFLVTQMPLPNTVNDIWRLIYDHNCNSIVMMNDQTEHDENCLQYWPESGTKTYGPFTVELLTKDDEVDVVSRLFKLQNMSRQGEGFRLVQQFQLTNWPGSQPVPFSRNAVLRVVQLATKWQSECARNGDRGRVAVHCVAGAGRSGTFVACHNMCEQMRQEFSVDVFNIVQRLRNIRPQLVETLEQYRFCYEVGIEFADQ